MIEREVGVITLQALQALEEAGKTKPNSLEHMRAIEDWKDAVCSMYELEYHEEAQKLIEYGRADANISRRLEQAVEAFEQHGKNIVPILRPSGLTDQTKTTTDKYAPKRWPPKAPRP